jgi:hypothetical protein
MVDTASSSPFARLDTSLMRSTKQQQETDTSVKNKETSFQGNQQTSKLGNKETVKHVSQETSKRVIYPKVTYQLNPTVTNLLQDTKIALQRQFNIKVSLAEIVEEAIQKACVDLQVNKETRNLALDSKLILVSIIEESLRQKNG